MKTKVCSSCGFKGSMWKSKPLLCRNCANREPVTRDNKDSEVLVTKEKKYPVRSSIILVSDKQKERLKEFRKVRDTYMKANPICEFPDCTNPSTDLHHGAGKISKLLTDVRYFKALDRKHHDWCELNPLEAQKLGLSFKRLDK